MARNWVRISASGAVPFPDATDQSPKLVELLEEVVHVYLVPAFDYLIVADGEEGCSVLGDPSAGRRDAEMISEVGSFDAPANGNLVSFGDNLMEGDVQVGEGTDKGLMDAPEGCRPGEDGIGFWKAVGFAFGAVHFVDSGVVFLVPDFFKPADGELPGSFGVDGF
jgi:hypothetical protein